MNIQYSGQVEQQSEPLRDLGLFLILSIFLLDMILAEIRKVNEIA